MQEVVLSFTPVQGKYVKTLPWHKSQKILVDNDRECRISLQVIPNLEMTQEILKHGMSDKVLKTDWLVEEIRMQLQDALDQYKHEKES